MQKAVTTNLYFQYFFNMISRTNIFRNIYKSFRKHLQKRSPSMLFIPNQKLHFFYNILYILLYILLLLLLYIILFYLKIEYEIMFVIF